MGEIDGRALDRWITTEPEYDYTVLVTPDNFAEVFGHDKLLINELRCKWTSQYVGYTVVESDNEYWLSFVPFYTLDEAREICVHATAYDDEQERIDEQERELDRQEREWRATRGDN